MRFRRPHAGVLPAFVRAGAGAAASGWSSDFDGARGPGSITARDGTPTAFGVGLRDHLRTLP
jgi:hypothetical protein